MKNKFLIFLVLATQFSCNLDDDISGDDYSFTGRLYKNCEKEPHANMELNVYTENDKTFSSDEKFYQQIQTDDNGRFYFEFGSRGFDRFNVYNNTNNLVCRIGVTSDRWLYEPNQTSELYSRTRLRHPVKILTDKPYTEQDTLFVGAQLHLSEALIISGPFLDKSVFLSEEMGFVRLSDQIAPFHSETVAQRDFFWGIGRESYDMVRTTWHENVPNNYALDVPERLCDGDTIVIDLRKL
jgi:hypothetical protein